MNATEKSSPTFAEVPSRASEPVPPSSRATCAPSVHLTFQPSSRQIPATVDATSGLLGSSAPKRFCHQPPSCIRMWTRGCGIGGRSPWTRSAAGRLLDSSNIVEGDAS
eukprot:169898-Prymnesium_polylepis.1